MQPRSSVRYIQAHFVTNYSNLNKEKLLHVPTTIVPDAPDIGLSNDCCIIT
jgi:hypothetical protein